MPAAVPGSTKRARVITGNKRSLSCSDSDSATEQNGFGPLSLLDPLINEMDGQTTADASRGKTILRGYLTGPRPRPPELKPLVTISILYHHREVAVTAVTNPSWLRVRAVLIRSIVPQYFCGGVSSQMALSLRKRVTS